MSVNDLAKQVQSLFPSDVHTVVAEREASGQLLPAEAAMVTTVVGRRRYEFTQGRLCARAAMTNMGIGESPLLPDDHRGPRWPAGVVGSITHCEGFTGAAVTRVGSLIGLGLDAEPATPLIPELTPRVCVAEERRWISETPVPAWSDWPKVIFCAKEALHKCLHPTMGLTLDFRDVEVLIAPGRGRFAVRPSTRRMLDHSLLRRVVGRFYISPSHVVASAVLPAA